jgi:hypothetical protein
MIIVARQRKKIIPLSDLLPRARHAEGPVPDPFDGGQGVRQFLNHLGLSPGGDDLQTVMVIQVDVLGRDDHLLEIVLGIRHPGKDVPLVMIVDERDGAGHVAALPPFPLDQFPADQVPQGLRAVGVLPFPDQGIEPVQEGLFQGNPETNQFGHLQITILRLAVSYIMTPYSQAQSSSAYVRR